MSSEAVQTDVVEHPGGISYERVVTPSFELLLTQDGQKVLEDPQLLSQLGKYIEEADQDPNNLHPHIRRLFFDPIKDREPNIQPEGTIFQLLQENGQPSPLLIKEYDLNEGPNNRIINNFDLADQAITRAQFVANILQETDIPKRIPTTSHEAKYPEYVELEVAIPLGMLLVKDNNGYITHRALLIHYLGGKPLAKILQEGTTREDGLKEVRLRHLYKSTVGELSREVGKQAYGHPFLNPDIRPDFAYVNTMVQPLDKEGKRVRFVLFDL